MSEVNPQAPATGQPAAGGTAPTSAAGGGQPNPGTARQALADLDSLVEINVLGKREVVPLRAAVAELQGERAGRAQLDEAKRMRSENAAALNDAENWRRLQANIAEDPDGAVAKVQRLANMAKGSPSATRTAHVPGGASHVSDESDDVDPQVRGLDGRLRNLELREHQTQLQREVAGVMDLYPGLKASPALWNSLELTLLAARSRDPNAPLERVAAQFHTGVTEIAGGTLTQVRDARADRQERMPHMPAQSGSPELQTPPKPTSKSLRDGSWDKEVAGAWDKLMNKTLGH